MAELLYPPALREAAKHLMLFVSKGKEVTSQALQIARYVLNLASLAGLVDFARMSSSSFFNEAALLLGSAAISAA
jgi:hypothetical protein